MEERIEQLEKDLAEAREMILILCERLDEAEQHIENAYSIYQEALKNPLAKAFIKNVK